MTINKGLFCRPVSVSRGGRADAARASPEPLPGHRRAEELGLRAAPAGDEGRSPRERLLGSLRQRPGPSRRWTRPPAPSLRRHRLEARASTFQISH